MGAAAAGTPATAPHPRLHALIERARAVVAARPVAQVPRIALVHPGDTFALRAAVAMAELGIARPLLVGSRDTIARAAAAAGVPVDRFEVVAPAGDSPAPAAAAERAVALAREGAVSALMKGSLHTDELLAAVVHRSAGLLRRDTRISHTFVFDLPRYHKLLALTDCVVNVAPKLRAKEHILGNAVHLLRCLGVATPKVAVVSAVETVTEVIPATLDARALVETARSGTFGNAIVEGPFAFDNAFSAEAARIKGLQDSVVAGDADLMLMPGIDAGNMLYKSFVYVGGGECAGLVLGVQVPVILTSRADSPLARLASVALAVLSSAPTFAPTEAAA